MAVATTPFFPDALALLRLAYHSRAGVEIESSELPYPARVPGALLIFGDRSGTAASGTPTHEQAAEALNEVAEYDAETGNAA